MATNAQLLAEAKRKYPEGTEYYNPIDGSEVTSNGIFIWEEDRIVEEDFENDVVYDPVKGWAKLHSDLIEEANKRYPVGTVFKCLQTNSVCEVYEDEELVLNHIGIESNSDRVYDPRNNKWAEIDQKLTKALADARKMFVIGTVFECLQDGCTFTISDEPSSFTIDLYEIFDGNGNTLYRHGKFAKIISSPSNYVPSSSSHNFNSSDERYITLPIVENVKTLTIVNID